MMTRSSWVKKLKVSDHALMRYIQKYTGVPEFNVKKMEQEWLDKWRKAIKDEIERSKSFQRRNSTALIIKHGFKKADYYRSIDNTIFVIGLDEHGKLGTVITAYEDKPLKTILKTGG